MFDFASATRWAGGGTARASAKALRIWSRTYGASSAFFTRAKTLSSSGSAFADIPPRMRSTFCSSSTRRL